MQRDEVFYLHSNLLFQQLTDCCIGFLGLVEKAPGNIPVSLAAQPHQFTKTKALGQEVRKEENNNINKQEKNPGGLGTSTPQRHPYSSQLPRWPLLYPDTETTE